MSAGPTMQGFKHSPLHCPIHKVKIKKRYYRLWLVTTSIGILWVHYHAPDYEAHAALLVNVLFAIDPTA